MLESLNASSNFGGRLPIVHRGIVGAQWAHRRGLASAPRVTPKGAAQGLIVKQILFLLQLGDAFNQSVVLPNKVHVGEVFLIGIHGLKGTSVPGDCLCEFMF